MSSLKQLINYSEFFVGISSNLLSIDAVIIGLIIFLRSCCIGFSFCLNCFTGIYTSVVIYLLGFHFICYILSVEVFSLVHVRFGCGYFECVVESLKVPGVKFILLLK